MKKYLHILLLVFLIIPSVTFASWWNPLSWKVFSSNKAPEKTIQKTQSNSTTRATSTVTTTSITTVNTPERNIKGNSTSTSKNQPKEQVQQISQIKNEEPTTTIVSLPSGTIVEMDSVGNIIRTIKEVPQQAYVPTPITVTQQAIVSEPISRTLEISTPPSDGTDKYIIPGSNRVMVSKFILIAGGNTDTTINKVQVRLLSSNLSSFMWIESEDGSVVGTKTDQSVSEAGELRIYLPITAKIKAGSSKSFVIYADTTSTARNYVEVQITGINSDSGTITGLPAMWQQGIVLSNPEK